MIQKCGQVNTKMQSKIDVNLKLRFLKNRALAAAGARFFIIGASKLQRKIDRKSITKPSTRWNAPWHRLSFDFGRFRSASSGGKTIQNRCRKTSKIVMLLARGRLRPGSKGVFPLPSSGNTQDPRRCVSRGVGDSYCDFFGNLVALLFCIVFRCLFGSILAPVSLPTCLPKSTKIQEKSMPRCHPSWTPFFDRFLVGFGSQLGPI